MLYKKPVNKLKILSEIEHNFSFRYAVLVSLKITNAIGRKVNYYLVNHAARQFGYSPEKTSMSGVVEEIKKYMTQFEPVGIFDA